MKGVVSEEEPKNCELKKSNIGSSQEDNINLENMGKGNLNVSAGVEDAELLDGINNLGLDDASTNMRKIKHDHDINDVLRKINSLDLNSRSPSSPIKIPVEDEEPSSENEEEAEKNPRQPPNVPGRQVVMLDGREQVVVPKGPLGGVPVDHTPINNDRDHDTRLQEILGTVDPAGKYMKPNLPRETTDFSNAGAVSNTFNFNGGHMNGSANYFGVDNLSEMNVANNQHTYNELSMRRLNGGSMQCLQTSVPTRNHFNSESTDYSASTDEFNPVDEDSMDQFLLGLSSPGSSHSPFSDDTEAPSPASNSSVFGPQSPQDLVIDDNFYVDPVNNLNNNDVFSDIAKVLGKDMVDSLMNEASRQGLLHDKISNCNVVQSPPHAVPDAPVMSNSSYGPTASDPLSVNDGFNIPNNFHEEASFDIKELMTNIGLDISADSLAGMSNNVAAPNPVAQFASPQSQHVPKNNPKRKLPSGNPHSTYADPLFQQNPPSQFPQNPHSQFQQLPQTTPYTYTPTIPVPNITAAAQNISSQNPLHGNYGVQGIQNPQIKQRSSPSRVHCVSASSANIQQVPAPVSASLTGAAPVCHVPRNVQNVTLQGITSSATPAQNIGPLNAVTTAKVVQTTSAPIVISFVPGVTTSSQPVVFQTLPTTTTAPIVTLPGTYIFPSQTSIYTKPCGPLSQLRPKQRPILPKEKKDVYERPAPPTKLEPLEEDKLGEFRPERNFGIKALRWVQSQSKLYDQDEDGDTLLHCCALKGLPNQAYAVVTRVKSEKKTKEGLLEYVNKGNNKGQTALYLATVVNCPEIVSLLISEGADPNSQSMRRQPSGEIQYLTAIHTAARNGETYLPVLKYLLSSPSLNKDAPDFFGYTALHIAAREHGKMNANREKIDSTKTLQVLLRHGADINKQDGKTGQTILHYLVEARDVTLLRNILGMLPTAILTHALQQLSYKMETCLHVAAQLPRYTAQDQLIQSQILEILLDYGVDTSVKNSQQKTAKDLLRPQDFSDTKLLERLKPKRR